MTSEYRQPQFLSPDDEPRHRVRCPVHGFIRFSPNERKVIDHRLFRRLRAIRQLALTEYVYPGATHTRFEHSLGVMEVATRMFDALAGRYGSRMEAVFGRVRGFEDRPLEHARQYLRLAALLHDLGHTCFSHAAEKILSAAGDHEQVTQTAIREDALLGGLLDTVFGPGTAAWVATLLQKEGLPPQFRVLKDLVSGQMDADRTDYLLRDSLHCGVEYGRFDYLRLIESLAISSEHEEDLQLAVDRGGIHAFEALILARYQMNTQVYYHRLRVLYDHYLEQYFQQLVQGNPWSVEELLRASDFAMFVRIQDDAEQAEGELRQWAGRLNERKHHRLIDETSDDATRMQLRRSKQVHARLQAAVPDRELLWIQTETANHKILVPDVQEDATDHVTIRVIYPHRWQDIGEVSRILARIPRRFQCARIFADLPRSDPSLQQQLEEEANRAWENLGGR